MERITEQVSTVVDYLENNVLPSFSELSLTDKAGLKVHSLEIAQVAENEMREKMYSTDLFDDDTFYLEEVTEAVFDTFDTIDDCSVLLMKRNLIKRPLSGRKQELEKLRVVASLDNVLVAGGAVYSSLFVTTTGDIDLFLYGLTPSEAEKKIGEVAKIIALINTKVIRTKNAVTFVNTSFGIDVQIILRIYRTKSEILHGFDVDSCCLGYDGDKVWATRRALFSLQHGYNTVSFDRLSPSYELRLMKYSTKGMAIKVPDFCRNNIKSQELTDYYKRNKAIHTSLQSNYSHLKNLKGLDVLLFFEERMRQNHREIQRTAEDLCKESSDYSPIPLADYSYGRIGTSIFEMLGYLDGSRDDYVEKSDVYVPLLEEWFDAMESREKHGRIIGNPTLEKSIKECDECFHHNNCHKHKIEVEIHNGVITKDVLNNITGEYEVDKDKVMDFHINSFLKSGCLFMVKGSVCCIREILHFPEDLYAGLSSIKPITFPKDLEWKVTNPGEQMTNTFHQIVLEDTSTWYNCRFYRQQ